MSQSSYLTTVKRSFVDVPITDEGVDTAAFLEASEGVVGLFDFFTNPAFTPVQSDMRGNIAKVRARLESHPAESTTLEKLVENEAKEKKRPTTEGLMWLLRGLSFTCQGLQYCQQNKSEELSAGFSKSYEKTLKPHHNFIVKGMFSLAMGACPKRDDFYKQIATTDQELNAWLDALNNIVVRMQTFYEKNGYNKGI